jgi:ferric-dicitrate binding protein FerR (iron transport regulator)
MDIPRSHELLHDWLAGDLDKAGADDLLALCRRDPALLAEAARLRSIDRLLRASLLDAGPESFVEEVRARCETQSTPHDFTRAIHWRLRWRRWVSLAAAACVLLALALWAWQQSRPVATIESAVALRWGEGRRAHTPAETLRRGRVAFDKGLLALRFASGTQLLVEGPADLDLRSRSTVRLYAGSIVANVPKPAIGFTVEGPTGRVVDKGTEFGVRVGEGRMEVHVLKGLVEAGRGTALQPVREREALQITSNATKLIPADANRFLTTIPPTATRPVGWIHWSFDDATGGAAVTQLAGLRASATPARLRTLDGESSGPTWTEGQFGTALSFDGEDDYVQTDYEGISGSAARTVAFWVKVPRALERKNSYALVCWGSTEEAEEAWQISINPRADEGVLGGLRVARIGGPIVGATDLRDDHWHHVAVVFYGGAHRRHSTQVLIYIDGELESTVRKGVQDVRTDTASPNARKVAFALNLSPYNPLGPAKWRVFRGCLDEVFICDAALSQAQVTDLMTRNFTDAFARAETR